VYNQSHKEAVVRLQNLPAELWSDAWGRAAQRN